MPSLVARSLFRRLQRQDPVRPATRALRYAEPGLFGCKGSSIEFWKVEAQRAYHRSTGESGDQSARSGHGIDRLWRSGPIEQRSRCLARLWHWPASCTSRLIMIFVLIGILLFYALPLVFAGWRLRRCPWLPSMPLPMGEVQPLPSVSVVVAARNEAAALPQAVQSLLDLDYPLLELIVVNDRSTDRSRAVLEELAARDPRLRIVTIEHLPPEWIGKSYALHVGSGAAMGEFLLFADADVTLEKSALQHALAFVRDRKLDHLTAIPDYVLVGFWERLMVGFFVLHVSLRFRVWAAGKRSSKACAGIGAFNLVRASTYRAFGGHESLRFELIDDVMLGRRVKAVGGRSQIAWSGPLVRVRWQVGLSGVLGGLKKNMFPSFGFNLGAALASVFGSLVAWGLPVVALAAGDSAVRITAALVMALHAIAWNLLRLSDRRPWWIGLAMPAAGLLLASALMQSVFVIWWRGGVVWRDTLYPLDALRRARST